MRYDAVIFDLFGTLIDFLSIEEYKQWDVRMADALSAPRDDFRREWLATLHDRNLGIYDNMDQEVRHICTALGITPDESAIAEVNKIRLEVMRINLKPKPGAIETLAKLKAQGYGTCMLSDCPLEIPLLWGETPFATLMDSAVFSCLERITKPSPEIYRLAWERIGVVADRCVYVGDGGGNELTGARNVGMRPILIRTSYGKAFERHQGEASVWQGEAISDLQEVIGLLD